MNKQKIFRILYSLMTMWLLHHKHSCVGNSLTALFNFICLIKKVICEKIMVLYFMKFK